ncbi:MAG: hypothetical protein RMK51_08135 [Meiothermus sp.]|uniref:hypothetical protein n=1 Tax=Meiothermus sp. TaxID=1955249 RepID=UPI0025DAEE8B|nr:hypothetical protein [Meiothermus sp.]MCS7067066.1 hypothetical protein [Meiothermus sp.]MDW8425889.1 hypothetical protein [Meiothermus sp.]
MRKIVVLVLVAVLSGAFAQGRLFGEVAGGNISLVPGFSLGVQARMGAENVLGPLALRGGFSLFTGTGTAFGIGADVIYFLRSSGSPDFYFGGGLGLVSSGGTLFGINGNVGLEVPVTRDFNFFLELQPALQFAGGSSNFVLGIEFGPRLYFR